MNKLVVDYTLMTRRVAIYGLVPTDKEGIYQNHDGRIGIDLSATGIDFAEEVIIKNLMSKL